MKKIINRVLFTHTPKDPYGSLVLRTIAKLNAGVIFSVLLLICTLHLTKGTFNEYIVVTIKYLGKTGFVFLLPASCVLLAALFIKTCVLSVVNFLDQKTSFLSILRGELFSNDSLILALSTLLYPVAFIVIPIIPV